MEITSLLRVLASTVVAVIVSLVFNKILPFKDVKQEIPKCNTRIEAFWAIGLSVLLLVITALVFSATVKAPESPNTEKTYCIGGAVGQLLVCCIFMGLPLYVVLKLRNQKMTSLGFTRINLVKSVILPLIVLPTFIIGSDYKSISVEQGILKFLTFSSVGFFEEIFFRGYLQTRLINWIGKWQGLLLSAFIFSIWHIPHRVLVEGMTLSNAILAISVMFFASSLIFGWIFLLTKNIAAPIILHILMDWWEA